MSDGDDQALEDLLERFRDVTQEELHTASIGRVVRYDAEAGTVDIQPLIHRSIPRADGTRVREVMPIVRAVPVVFPGSGDWFIRWPVSVGDTFLMLFCERDISRWRTTGEMSDPVDVRAHHLAHATAVPGVRSRVDSLPTPTGTALEIGMRGGATIRINDDGTVQIGGSGAVSPVADASKVDAVFDAIAGAATGDAIPAAVTAALAALVPPGTTALTKVTGV